jgi:translocation and assembly module TamA
VALLLLLRLPAVQGKVLAVALRKGQETSGLSLRARGLSIDPLRGRVRLRGLVAAVPGSRPFLDVAAADFDLDLGEAIHRRLRIRRLSLEGVRIDLGAPLPAGSGGATGGQPASLPAFEVDEIDVGISSIVSGPLPPELQRLALAVKAERVRLKGSFRRGALSLQGDVPSVLVDRPGPLRLTAAGAFSLSLTPAGRLLLEDLHLSGNGFSATASGTGGLSPDAPLAFHAEMHVTAETVAPELATTGDFVFSTDIQGSPSAVTADLTVDGRDVVTPEASFEAVSAKARFRQGVLLVEDAAATLLPGGRVAGSGRYDSSSGEGTWSLRAERLPDALLERHLDEAARRRMGLLGTELDAAATVAHGPGDPLPLTVDADLSLRRGETPLALATARLSTRGPATLDLSANLLPASPGERRASGQLRARSLAGLASGRLVDGRLQASAPDLAASWAELRSLFPALVPAAPADVDLGGAFRVDLRASGALGAPAALVEAAFEPVRGGSLSVVATADPARGLADGRAFGISLPLEAFRPGSSGLASFDASFGLGPGRRDVALDLDATGLCLADEAPLLETLHARVELDLGEARLLELGVETPGGPFASPGAPTRLEATGRVSLAGPFDDADLDVTASAGGVSAEARVFVRDGVLLAEVPRAGTPGFEAILSARLPLGALRAFPTLAGGLPAGLPAGPLELTIDAPQLDSCALAPLLPAGTPLVPVVAGLGGYATFDFSDLLGGTAELAIREMSAETDAGPLALSRQARVVFREGRISVEDLAVEGLRTSFTASASAEILPTALSGGPLPSLLGRIEASARGRAEAALLDPFLAGGTATGEVVLDVTASGTPDALEGKVFLDGQGTRFSWPLTWPTEIRDPLLEVDLTPGKAVLSRGEAILNGGALLLSGGASASDGLSLTALFADVRYRLAYGLAAVLSGDLTFTAREEERRVFGNVTLDRGILDRDIDLDREILARVLAPPESSGTETTFLDSLALEIGLGTASGIRIRNNVADLSASWTRLDITGTGQNPVVRGRIDVARGGLVFAYGQTFRVDKGAVTYTGDPASDPRLDFVTTSSLQDRSVGARAAEGDVFAGARFAEAGGEKEVDAAAELAHGLAGYYGDRLASQLGAALGRVSLGVRPLLLLGEVDPAARLTLSRDFSPNVTLAVGLDLRNAQRQTWVVDVHGLRRLPPLAAQVFTEDFGSWGGTLQQRIEIGGTRRGSGEDADAPLLAAIRVTPPRDVSRRAFVSALRLRKGDPAGRAALFEAEIDAEAFLRDQGWPEAQVTLRTVPARKAGRVDVEAGIDLGLRVEVSFAGDRLPSASRAAVAGLYRTGALEAGALEEMRRETLRALRALGHLAPRAEVTVEAAEGTRRVVVTTAAGRKVEIREVVFEDVSPGEAAVLARRFSSTLERIELAGAFPSADRRLLETLRALGYPRGRILARSLEDGDRLVLRLDPGPPSLVESVAVRGVPRDEALRLSRFVRLSPGEPADADRTALSALAMEDALRAEGFAEARVRTVLSPATPEDPPRLAVGFHVEKGVAEHLGSVRVDGLSRTSEAWARRVAGLDPGSGFRRDQVDEARGELFSLGLFRSVRGETVPGPDGRVDVVLTAEELPPLNVAYGVRWENERGFAAVVDVSDRNLFGRGLTLGARALYDPDDRAIRAFAGVPERVLGAAVDFWVEKRRVEKEGFFSVIQTDSTEASVQLSRSIGRFFSARLYGRWKETRVFEDDPFFPLDVTIQLPYLGAQFVRDTREDPLLGTRGLLASLDVQGSGSWLGSSFSFVRAFGQANLYRPVFSLGAGRVVWAQSVRAGWAHAFDGQELVPDVRFFAGGSYSVRGYPSESLGPREDLGGTFFATGGSTLLVVNEELRVPLHPRLLGVGFFDVGQVWASSSDFGTGLATSVGLGLRALTPLGVLRLDGAVPLNRREGDPSWRVTFGFGNIF